ncbi:MAG: hypothetical protein OEM62_04435 [Acidobacteriota bacterium]|nr:hypothetical protein [Acidobacteriota bacterium]
MMGDEISFSSVELASYLPAGWKAAENGAWDSTDGLWRVLVRDVADQEWRLEISGRDAGEMGRTGALRRAVDRLYREALG